MTTPEDSSTSSFPPEIQKTKPTPSSISISKFVDDIAVGNVTASAGAISCSAPNPRPTYLQALLGDNPPLLGPFNQAKERLCQSEDFPELVSTDLVSTKYTGLVFCYTHSNNLFHNWNLILRCFHTFQTQLSCL